MDGALTINISTDDYAAFAARARAFPGHLRANLVREFDAEGRALQRDLERAVLGLRLPALPPSRRHRSGHTGLRRRVAASITATTRATGDGVETKVTAANRMAKPLNQPEFRHPVYGHRDRPWVTQRSEPWWGRTLAVRGDSGIRDAGARALNQAVDDL